MDKKVKNALFGVLAWLVPFVLSIFLYTPQGNPIIDVLFFKSIMIVTGGIVGAFLIVKYFEGIKKEQLKEGITIGVSWLMISYILDIVVLLPMAGMDIATWFTQIGLRYLMMPIMSIMAGYILEKKK